MSARLRGPGAANRLLRFAVGALLAAAALELLLRPHQIMPGGLEGVAILVAHAVDARLGLVLMTLQLPLLWLARRSHPAFSLAQALIGSLLIAGATLALHAAPPLLALSLPAAVLGGAALGAGAGLMIRYGEYIGGVRELADYMRRRLPRLPARRLLLLCQLLLVLAAGWTFGWAQAIDSFIAFYAASLSLRLVLRSSAPNLLVRVRSRRSDALKERIIETYGSEAAWLESRDALSGPEGQQAGFAVVLPKRHKKPLETLLRASDPTAHVSFAPLEAAQEHTYSCLD